MVLLIPALLFPSPIGVNKPAELSTLGPIAFIDANFNCCTEILAFEAFPVAIIFEHGTPCRCFCRKRAAAIFPVKPLVFVLMDEGGRIRKIITDG